MSFGATDDPILPFAQTLDLPDGFELHVAAGAGHMLIEEAPSACRCRSAAGNRRRSVNRSLASGPQQRLECAGKKIMLTSSLTKPAGLEPYAMSDAGDNVKPIGSVGAFPTPSAT